MRAAVPDPFRTANLRPRILRCQRVSWKASTARSAPDASPSHSAFRHADGRQCQARFEKVVHITSRHGRRMVPSWAPIWKVASNRGVSRYAVASPCESSGAACGNQNARNEGMLSFSRKCKTQTMCSFEYEQRLAVTCRFLDSLTRSLIRRPANHSAAALRVRSGLVTKIGFAYLFQRSARLRGSVGDAAVAHQSRIKGASLGN